ncbi:phosphoribosylamine--glycine ligase [Desulfovibrio sp. OttesenSCG-928-G15]|nr:phosphoribosylamine--glycine ligase [Desulfovibrio sp. OttesenSCG-928-G15]
MRILIIGSGGREHALAWKLGQSPKKPELFLAPGNGGTALEGENVPLSDGDIPALMAFIKEKNIDFVIPGPELPLVKGIVDACEKEGVLCFGPKAYAAGLEGSKAFAKEVMKEAGVPTADFAVFTDHDQAALYVRQKNCPLVVKADGLAAGKGVVVAKNADEALEALKDMMLDKSFGAAGETVVIEDTLVGEEASFLAFCQGDTVIPLPSAQDHKAAFDNDQGPNTGGMGAYSPAPILPENRYDEIVDSVIRPVLDVLKKRGCPFSGILYAGLMMTAQGPMVLEFNVRFGDPECQPLLMRLEGDLVDVMQACASGRLHEVTLGYTRETALCVVVAAQGYPGDYEKGMELSGLAEAEKTSPGKIKVFQAGTRYADGKTLSTGGRILGVTALGETLAQARKNAYEAVGKLRIPGCRYRSDIGNKGLR